MNAEPLTDTVAQHGEGAVWDDRDGRVLWVDMFAGRILKTDPASGTTVAIPVGSSIAAVVRPSGREELVVGRRSDVCILEGDGSSRVLTTLLEGPDVRLNEGGCDPAGRLVVGSVSEDERPGAGCLWQVHGNGETSVLLDRVTISNGVAFSGDGSAMYYVDTATHRVDEYPYDLATGEIGRRRTFADLRGLGVAGYPDGICTDAEGGVWVAVWGGRSVIRLDGKGKLDGVVDVPSLNVTSCTFGGPGHATLYITTSAHDDPSSSAGRLYTCEPGVRGKPTHQFQEISAP